MSHLIGTVISTLKQLHVQSFELLIMQTVFFHLGGNNAKNNKQLTMCFQQI